MNERPLRQIRPSADGVGIGVEFVNDVIKRIEELVIVAQGQRLIAGQNVSVQRTPDGTIINVVSND